jgi:hypothetical protein
VILIWRSASSELVLVHARRWSLVSKHWGILLFVRGHLIHFVALFVVRIVRHSV